MNKLPPQFYQRTDVVTIAKELLGKVLVTHFNGQLTTGRIVETEAYEGEGDKASHASKGRTGRTEVMYAEGGVAYVYLIYGVHQLFNVVTGPKGLPHAVLVRAVEPMEGVEIMRQRSGNPPLTNKLTDGPGKVGRAFGFHTSQSGTSLGGAEMYIADDGFVVTEESIVASARIGVAYAADHAEWLYRFYIKGNPFVSGKRER